MGFLGFEAELQEDKKSPDEWSSVVQKTSFFFLFYFRKAVYYLNLTWYQLLKSIVQSVPQSWKKSREKQHK